ncbi:hypothetical protein H0X48_05865 [Candidatus Dependentiae bacterium]|nr:hypothetical protein [Candidatus Dependentiae bacterium]
MKTNVYGISLLEVTLSVSVLLLIVSLSMPLFVMHNRLFVKAELENIYGLMLYLQRKASVEQQIQTLILDVKKSSYRAHGEYTKLARDVVFAQPAFITDKNTQFKGFAKSSTFKNNTVVFYPDGTITSGSLFLTDSKHSCAYALTCGVGKVGFIRKYRYSGNKWVLLS